MSYVLEKSVDANTWVVVEKGRGRGPVNLIMCGKRKGKSIARSLNLGAGFKGNTPRFFLDPDIQKGDSNK